MSDALGNLLMVARTSLEKRQNRILERQALDKLLVRDAELISERVAKAETTARGISAEGLCDETLRALAACESWRFEDDGILYFPEPKKKPAPVVDLTIKKRKKESSKASLLAKLREKLENEDNDLKIEVYEEQIRALEEESSTE